MPDASDRDRVVVSHDHSLADRLEPEDGGLPSRDDRHGDNGAERAGVRDRERAPRQVVRGQLLRTSLLRDLVDLPRQADEVLLVGVLDHGNDQTPALECHRDAEVDVVLDAVRLVLFVEGRVHFGHLEQGLAQSSPEERHVREVEPLSLLEGVFGLLAELDDVGPVHFDRVPRTRRLARRGDHVLGGASADVRPGHELFPLARLLRGRGLAVGLGGRFGGGGRTCLRLPLARLDVLQDILLADPSPGAGALDVVEVDLVLVGEPAHERRDDPSLRGVGPVALGLRLLVARGFRIVRALFFGCGRLLGGLVGAFILGSLVRLAFVALSLGLIVAGLGGLGLRMSPLASLRTHRHHRPLRPVRRRSRFHPRR